MVTREVLPEVDDDFAKDVSIPNVETAEDLRKTVRERLENTKKQNAENEADNKLIDQIVEHTSVELPDALVDEEINNQIQQLANQISQYGMSLTQYLSMMGKKPEDLKEDYRENAVKTVTTRLALEKIAEAENIVPTDEDLNKEYEEIAKAYNMEADKVRSLINPDMLKKDVANQKAFELVKDNAEKAEKTAE